MTLRGLYRRSIVQRIERASVADAAGETWTPLLQAGNDATDPLDASELALLRRLLRGEKLPKEIKKK